MKTGDEYDFLRPWEAMVTSSTTVATTYVHNPRVRFVLERCAYCNCKVTEDMIECSHCGAPT